MKRTKKQKGITLVALIITIIVLLILAVVAIRAVQGDGIIAYARNARSNYIEAQIAENGTIQNYADYITGQIGNSSDSETKESTWIQDGINVTNGTVTLKVGRTVSNFTAGGYTWKVFGAEDGKLLLMTQEKTETGNTLSGTTSKWNEDAYRYTGLEDDMHADCAAAVNITGTKAEQVRCPTLEDLNRITGFVPTVGVDNGQAGGLGNVPYGNSMYFNQGSEKVLANGRTMGSYIGYYLPGATDNEVKSIYGEQADENGNYIEVKITAYSYEFAEALREIDTVAADFLSSEYWPLATTVVGSYTGDGYTFDNVAYSYLMVESGKIAQGNYEAVYDTCGNWSMANVNGYRPVAVMQADFVPEMKIVKTYKLYEFYDSKDGNGPSHLIDTTPLEVGKK